MSNLFGNVRLTLLVNPFLVEGVFKDAECLIKIEVSYALTKDEGQWFLEEHDIDVLFYDIVSEDGEEITLSPDENAKVQEELEDILYSNRYYEQIKDACFEDAFNN